jgi:hypothetical protein
MVTGVMSKVFGGVSVKAGFPVGGPSGRKTSADGANQSGA